MDVRRHIVLGVRVVPGPLLGWRHAGARDRMPASRFGAAALRAIRGWCGAGVGLADRRARPAFAPETPADTARVGVRAGPPPVGPPEPPAFPCPAPQSV